MLHGDVFLVVLEIGRPRKRRAVSLPLIEEDRPGNESRGSEYKFSLAGSSLQWQPAHSCVNSAVLLRAELPSLCKVLLINTITLRIKSQDPTFNGVIFQLYWVEKPMFHGLGGQKET